MARKPVRKQLQPAAPLVVLIPGAGPRGTDHPFFSECRKAFNELGFNVASRNVNDAKGITPIGFKVEQIVNAVGPRIAKLQPAKVMVIGHSQGYVTGWNTILRWRQEHPTTEFYLMGVSNPRSRKEHDDGFNRFRRIMGQKPVKVKEVSNGVDWDADPDLQIRFKRDPLLDPTRGAKIPRSLARRRALADNTHFLKNETIRREIIGMLTEFAQEARFRAPGENRRKEMMTLG